MINKEYCNRLFENNSTIENVGVTYIYLTCYWEREPNDEHSNKNMSRLKIHHQIADRFPVKRIEVIK